MIYNVGNASQLFSTLSVAKSGDTILLAPGDYGNLSFRNLTFEGSVKIASQDANDPAVFTGMTIANSQGLTLENIEIDLSTPWTSWSAQVLSSKNIELNGVDVHGDLAGSVATAPAGLLIRDSSGVKVTGGEFQQLEKAMFLLNSNNVELSGNAFHHIRSDGVDSAGTSNVKIIGNTFTDFFPATGDHPDAIQFMTVGTTASAYDILISGNLIARGEGGIMQGIFLTDQVGTLPYQRVTITDNVVAGAMYNGIMVDSARDVTVSGNTVAAYSDMASYIRLGNASQVTVTNNEVMKFIYSNLSGLTESGNQLISYLSTSAIAEINALVDANISSLLNGGVVSGPVTEPQPGDPTTTPTVPEVLVVTGTSGADKLTVSGTQDTRLEGGAGDDVLTGGGGHNVLLGGAGNDLYVIRDGDDVVVENAGEGVDTVYAYVDYTLTGNVENLKMLGDATVGVGNEISNWIDGTSRADLISGMGGDDTITGWAGDDTVAGGVGNDLLRGDVGNDRLLGDGGADTLVGGDGNDTLSGGDGPDRMEGGVGGDWLTGGAGADDFVYRPGDLGEVDVITDFSSAQGDRILLAEIDANSRTGANDKFKFIGTNAFSGKGGELRYEVVNGDAHVYGDINGDRVADLHIHLLGVTKLTASDFML